MIRSGYETGALGLRVDCLQRRSAHRVPTGDPRAGSARKLRIILLEGEGASAANNIRQRTARDPVLKVVGKNDRPAAGATLTFAAPPGDFANDAIAEWYASAESIDSGSTIAITVPLNVQGDFNALGQATISFTNSVGTSNVGQINVGACQ